MRPLLAAFHFLTTLPLPGGHRLRAEDWGRATAWYPLVGLVLGLILAGLDWALRRLWPSGVAAALLLAAWVALSGALHLDGLLDCCDALFAPVDRPRRLAILRDVHIGAFGLVGGVLLLLTKYAALTALPADYRLPALLLVPTLGRGAMTAALLRYPYARSEPGLGQKAKTGAGKGQLAVAGATTLLTTALTALLGLGWAAPALLLVTAAVGWLAAHWMQARLGGLTGDAYGALCELVETAGLLALSVNL